jgi:hypothetical protein
MRNSHDAGAVVGNVMGRNSTQCHIVFEILAHRQPVAAFSHEALRMIGFDSKTWGDHCSFGDTAGDLRCSFRLAILGKVHMRMLLGHDKDAFSCGLPCWRRHFLG